MEQVVKGAISIRRASTLLVLSERQVKRLKKGMNTVGIEALAHKSRGRKPHHALSEDTRTLIRSLGAGPFRGTSCTHMSELLAEYHSVYVSDRTIRRVLSAVGIDYGKHRAPKKRRLRDRMPQLGLLVQMDASPFDWLGARGPRLHLHGAIDDATSTVLALRFELQETSRGYLHVLSDVIRDYGVPCRVYTDLHTMFISPDRDKLTVEQELAGKTVNLTQLGRVFDTLGIQHIGAHSPQAKGRVERLWGTFQQRLLIELRLAGIRSLEEANAFLPGFIARYNARFACQPAQPESAFSTAPPADVLNTILAWQDSRQAAKDSTISFCNQRYQLVSARGQTVALAPGTAVTVVTHLDGSTSALLADKPFALKPAPVAKRATTQLTPAAKRTAPRPRPQADEHPWKQSWTKHSRPKLTPIERYLRDKDPYELIYPPMD